MAKKLIKEIQPGNFLNTGPEALAARKRHWDTAPDPEDFYRQIRKPDEALHAKGGRVKARKKGK